MKEEAIKAPGSTIKQYSIMLQNRVGAVSYTHLTLPTKLEV